MILPFNESPKSGIEEPSLRSRELIGSLNIERCARARLLLRHFLVQRFESRAEGVTLLSGHRKWHIKCLPWESFAGEKLTNDRTLRNAIRSFARTDNTLYHFLTRANAGKIVDHCHCDNLLFNMPPSWVTLLGSSCQTTNDTPRGVSFEWERYNGDYFPDACRSARLRCHASIVTRSGDAIKIEE